MKELQEHGEMVDEQIDQGEEIPSDANIIRWQMNRQVRRRL